DPAGARFAEGYDFAAPQLEDPTTASCRPAELDDAVALAACLRTRPQTADALKALLEPLGKILRLAASYESLDDDARRQMLEALEVEARLLADRARDARTP
ncbi:MAG: hypothetical protein AAGF23_24010, partial [Acidobacteriota bacterium]